MKMKIYHNLLEKKKKGQKAFAILIDPDKVSSSSLSSTIALANEAAADYLFVGGSLMVSNQLDECIRQIKEETSIPVVLFPGSPAQLSKYADALLYLSLISGRNSELLIGQHVLSAPVVKKS